MKADEAYDAHCSSGVFKSIAPNNQDARERDIFKTGWREGAEWQRQQDLEARSAGIDTSRELTNDR